MSVGEAYRMDFDALIQFVAMELNRRGFEGQFQIASQRVSAPPHYMSCIFGFHQKKFTLLLTEPHTEMLGGKALAKPGRFTTPLETGVFNANDFRGVIANLIDNLREQIARDDKRRRDVVSRPMLARAVVDKTEAVIDRLAQMTREYTAALAPAHDLDPNDSETMEFIRGSIVNRFFSSRAWKK